MTQLQKSFVAAIAVTALNLTLGYVFSYVLV